MNLTSTCSQRRRSATCLLVIALAATTLGCGDDQANELTGSIGEAGFTLDFNRVRISRSSRALLIEYVSEATLGNGQAVLNQPVRLEMDLSQVEASVDHPYDIPADVSIEHAVIALDSLGQPVDEPDFPRVSNGELTLHELGRVIPERVSGEFSCLFENNYTLNGKFSAKLSPP